ncbi:hypothetical protein R6Q59_003376 [Mikania micrantha]
MGHCTSTTVVSRTGNNIQKKEWIHHRREHGMLRRKGTQCLAAIREKRSRFYIIRKCVIMLVFWHKYACVCWCVLMNMLGITRWVDGKRDVGESAKPWRDEPMRGGSPTLKIDSASRVTDVVD